MLKEDRVNTWRALRARFLDFSPACGRKTLNTYATIRAMLIGYWRWTMSVVALHTGHAAHLVLLAAVGLIIALPLIDHHAIEYSPWHAHIVLGVSDDRERAWILATHHHTFEQPHQHDPVTGLPLQPHSDPPRAPHAAQVIVTADDSGSLVAYYWAAELGLTASPSLSLPPSGVWSQLASVDPLPSFSDIAPPLPPPRAA